MQNSSSNGFIPYGTALCYCYQPACMYPASNPKRIPQCVSYEVTSLISRHPDCNLSTFSLSFAACRMQPLYGRGRITLCHIRIFRFIFCFSSYTRRALLGWPPTITTYRTENGFHLCCTCWWSDSSQKSSRRSSERYKAPMLMGRCAELHIKVSEAEGSDGGETCSSLDSGRTLCKWGPKAQISLKSFKNSNWLTKINFQNII